MRIELASVCGKSNRSSPGSKPAKSKRSARLLVRLTTIGGFTLLAAGAASAEAAGPAMQCGVRPLRLPCVQYSFQTINNNRDNTFNQLLGINTRGKIAGYFGNGDVGAGHPNQGYLVSPNYGQGNFQMNNFPDSVQTQDTGLNDNGTVVGFWADQAGANFGWYQKNGQFSKPIAFPTTDNFSPPMNQLLGVNNNGVAVGFYMDAAKNDHGYWYDINSRTFHILKAIPTNVTNFQATAVNDNRDIAGFTTDANGNDTGFLIKGGTFYPVTIPNTAGTQVFGVNNSDELVGVYFQQNSTTPHGFAMKNLATPNVNTVYQPINDPNGVFANGTTANGIDVCGNVVGFSVDDATNTNGFLASVPPGTKPAADAASVGHRRHKKHKKHHKC
jgi:hypothetical protein